MSYRVLVVGSVPTANRVVQALSAAGHDATPCAVIETIPLVSPESIAAAVSRLPPGGLIVLSSPAAVRHLRDGSASAGLSLANRGAVVQGPGTAAEGRGAGLTIALEAPAHTAEGMFDAIRSSIPAPGLGMLLMTAEGGRGILERDLRAAGYAFEQLVLYRTQPIPPGLRGPRFAGPRDVVVFTSPSGVRAYLEDGPPPGNAELVAMGSATAGELGRAGLRAGRVAQDSSIEGLVRMLAS